MPGWLARLLPSAALTLALVGALWWLDQRGYARAIAERDARDAALLGQLRETLRQNERRLAASIAETAATYEQQRATIARTQATLDTLIREEIARDPRLSDPAAGLTPGLFDAVNHARAAGACAAAAPGRLDCALPPTGPATQSHDR